MTDTVLRTANGTDYKSVDKYELHLLIMAILQAAEQPRMRTVSRQLADSISFKFNPQQRFLDNMSVLCARTACLTSYGINFPKNMITTIILVEADDAAHKLWSRKIEMAKANLRLAYTYDYNHDSDFVVAILNELVVTDGVRNIMAVPTGHNAGQGQRG